MARHQPRIEQAQRTTTRCAIYTRKSTEEGLDQEFNSLDAQREACAAYVISQRHEGWTLIPEHYDDGGFTGGNMDRPGLRRVVDDVKAGKIDVIVVYKVDRLTRALSDFAKIVDVLDAAGASFVSITQSFNTTTSMGRLTLNVLLSFAQFEREVISERVRDKVAASKRKGMWMGGPVPLGYDVRDRKLVVNEPEAETVRYVMRRYVQLGTVRELMDSLAAEGIRSKVQKWKNGRTVGGTPLGRGALYHLLTNQLYRGEVAYRGEIYPGEHEAIVPPELWNPVQAQLKTNAVERRVGSMANDPSLLAGLIEDGEGHKLTPSHATKANRRYRYYVSIDPRIGKQIRIAAGDIERVVRNAWIQLFEDHADLVRMLNIQEAAQVAVVARRARELLAVLQSGEGLRKQLLDGGLEVKFDGCVAHCSVDGAALGMLLGMEQVPEVGRVPLRATTQITRRGHERRMIVASETGSPTQRDGRLIALLIKADQAREQLFAIERGGAPLSYGSKHLARMARLAFLAPDIVAAILDGRQPAAMTSRQLLRAAEIPLAWSDQRGALGFA